MIAVENWKDGVDASEPNMVVTAKTPSLWGNWHPRWNGRKKAAQQNVHVPHESVATAH